MSKGPACIPLKGLALCDQGGLIRANDYDRRHQLNARLIRRRT